MQLNDTKLTEEGLSPENPNTNRVLMLACGALAREILALNKLNDWDHIDLQCLPAKLHMEPDKIPEAVRAAVIKAREKGYENIQIVYADCGTGGMLDKVCEELDVPRIAGPHCYSFFDGNDVFEARGDADMMSYYLTDFMVRHFDSFIWKPLGLDRHPQLLDMYFANYEKVVYMAQIEDDVLKAEAEKIAARMKLIYEYRYTGYGDLASFMRDSIN